EDLLAFCLGRNLHLLLIGKLIVLCERYSLSRELARHGDVRPVSRINAIRPKVGRRRGGEFPGPGQVHERLGDTRDFFRQWNKCRPWPVPRLRDGWLAPLNRWQADIRGRGAVRPRHDPSTSQYPPWRNC